jgi:hypothetical protein
MDATERPVASSAAQWGALQLQALPPREPQSQQQQDPARASWAPR